MSVSICARKKSGVVESWKFEMRSAASSRRRTRKVPGVPSTDGTLAFANSKDKFVGFFTVCSLLFCLEKFVPLLL